MLIIPLVTKAGLGIGGAYGRGCLRINGVTVDYYSVTSGSFGLQIGAQQYAQVLFFMTDEALREFRSSSGWAVGGDVEYVAIDKGGNPSLIAGLKISPVARSGVGRKRGQPPHPWLTGAQGSGQDAPGFHAPLFPLPFRTISGGRHQFADPRIGRARQIGIERHRDIFPPPPQLPQIVIMAAWRILTKWRSTGSLPSTL